MDNRTFNITFSAVGKNVTMWPLAKIICQEVITICNSVIIDDVVFLDGGEKTLISSFVHFASFSSVTGGGEFVMEDFTGLSSGVRIFTGNEDYSGKYLTNPAVPYPYRVLDCSFIYIKKHAIVGANTVILTSVVIGGCAAIVANSSIIKDCDPWTIYAGSPVKPVRTQPAEHILELEYQLRHPLYDTNGKNVPKSERNLQ